MRTPRLAEDDLHGLPGLLDEVLRREALGEWKL